MISICCMFVSSSGGTLAVAAVWEVALCTQACPGRLPGSGRLCPVFAGAQMPVLEKHSQPKGAPGGEHWEETVKEGKGRAVGREQPPRAAAASVDGT